MFVKKLILGLLLALPLAANAATATFEIGTADTDADPNTSAAFTPANNDLVACAVHASGTVANPAALASSVGGQTFTQVAYGTRSGGGDSLYWFLSDQLATAVSQTVTFTATGDASTGTVIFCYGVAGMTRTGASALRQFATDFGGSTTTPGIDFASAALTGNPTLVLLTVAANPAAATPPTNWTEPGGGDLGFATPTAGAAVAHRDSGFTGTAIDWAALVSAGWGTLGIELDTSAAATPPAFSVSPTAAPAANGVTISGTITGTADVTVATVGVSPGDGTPTCTQIQAGQNDGGTAALATGSEIWVDSVSNSYTATGSNPIAVMDYHTCARNAAGDSSVVSLADEDRSPRAGFALVTHTSCAATAICDLDAYFNPDVAVGDVFEYESATNESANCKVLFAVNGNHVYYDSTDGANTTNLFGGAPAGIDESGDAGNDSIDDCAGKITSNISYEDVSSATTGLFTAPSVGNFTTDDLICNGNSPPAEDAEPEDEHVLLFEDEAMVARDLSALFLDADADALTVTETGAGTVPTGTTIASDGQWTGTPTTEDETGQALQATATDECGDSDTFDFTVYVTDDALTTPNVVGDTALEATVELAAVRPWLAGEDQLTATFAYDPLVAEGDIISQDPAASASMTALDPVQVVVSLGPEPSGGPPAAEAKIIFVLSSVSGLTQWVDYIPVSAVPGCDAGRYDENGCWAVEVLSSTTGLTAWVDYIPVFEVSQSANKWRYENDGWIPVNTLTP